MKRKLLGLSKTEAERVANIHRKAIIIDASHTTRLSKYAELNYQSMMKRAGCQKGTLPESSAYGKRP
jgi:hypothetical protein